MNDEILNLMKDFQEGHSDFQIKNFIIRCQGNNWMQYQQCLREIKGRLNLIAGWESKKIKKRFFRRRINGDRKPPNIRRAERELEIFVGMAKELKKVLGEITAEKRKHLETQAWIEKARRMVGIDLIASRGAGVSKQTIEFILQLPKDSRRELVSKLLSNDANEKTKMIEWILNT